MVNVTPDITEALQQTGLKVYDEGFLTKDTKMPCISIMEYENANIGNGKTIAYSEIVYHIKVWSTKQSELVSYSAQIDKIMHSLHFQRTSTNDLIQNSVRQRKLKYKATAFENY